MIRTHFLLSHAFAATALLAMGGNVAHLSATRTGLASAGLSESYTRNLLQDTCSFPDGPDEGVCTITDARLTGSAVNDFLISGAGEEYDLSNYTDEEIDDLRKFFVVDDQAGCRAVLDAHPEANVAEYFDDENEGTGCFLYCLPPDFINENVRITLLTQGSDQTLIIPCGYDEGLMDDDDVLMEAGRDPNDRPALVTPPTCSDLANMPVCTFQDARLTLFKSFDYIIDAGLEDPNFDPSYTLSEQDLLPFFPVETAQQCLDLLEVRGDANAAEFFDDTDSSDEGPGCFLYCLPTNNEASGVDIVQLGPGSKETVFTACEYGQEVMTDSGALPGGKCGTFPNADLFKKFDVRSVNAESAADCKSKVAKATDANAGAFKNGKCYLKKIPDCGNFKMDSCNGKNAICTDTTLIVDCCGSAPTPAPAPAPAPAPTPETGSGKCGTFPDADLFKKFDVRKVDAQSAADCKSKVTKATDANAGAFKNGTCYLKKIPDCGDFKMDSCKGKNAVCSDTTLIVDCCSSAPPSTPPPVCKTSTTPSADYFGRFDVRAVKAASAGACMAAVKAAGDADAGAFKQGVCYLKKVDQCDAAVDSCKGSKAKCSADTTLLLNCCSS